ncbi:MAG: hypothetical protein RRC34_16220 [Lentisphaeria bacterium]|nr:hypothetical protein [Lentisphaeria bacterium]
MQDWVQSLKAAQDKDLRIARLQTQVDAVPVDKKNAQATLDDAEGAVNEAKKSLQDVEMAIKTLQMDVEDAENKRRDFETKSMMIKDNNDYKAAMHQIETVKEKVGRLEEQELQLMEQRDTARERLEAEKKRFDAVAKRTNQHIDDLERRLQACETQKATLVAQRDELLADVPQDVARMYERLLSSRLRAGREPIGFAPVVNNSCSCCHMEIPPQVRVNAMKGQKVNCPQCSVLLYVDDE